MINWLVVTVNTYRNLFMAFETISHDSGGGAGHDNYSVHPAWRDQLAVAEAALSTLTGEREPATDEFEAFCIGEEGEHDDIAARSTTLLMTSKLLTSFFNDWDTGPDGEML